QVTADLLHLRMGHAGRQQLVECVKKGELKGVETKEGGGQPSKCPDCMTGKLPRTSFPTSTTRASAPLELVHTDVCGPMQTPEREKGSKYFITFLDDFSRLSWVTLVKTKDEVAKVFKHWIRYAEREAGAKVKILMSDRGGECMGKDLESFLEYKGITHQLSVAYTPQKNGAADRLNRTLIDLARAMLAHAQLDHTSWGVAVQYASWVKNQMGSKGLEGKSPYFMWTRKVPSVSMARVWGCMMQFKVPDQQLRKLDPKAQWGIFLGVSERSKSWMLWSVADQRVVESRDVVFHEGLSYKGTLERRYRSSKRNKRQLHLTMRSHQLLVLPLTLTHKPMTRSSHRGSSSSSSSNKRSSSSSNKRSSSSNKRSCSSHHSSIHHLFLWVGGSNYCSSCCPSHHGPP
ncbi:unnamed protein product, partial [Closterium sp. NIES-53]